MIVGPLVSKGRLSFPVPIISLILLMVLVSIRIIFLPVLEAPSKFVPLPVENALHTPNTFLQDREEREHHNKISKVTVGKKVN